ncbi:hypothetical protein BHE74_00024540 [Ensete ventricosum]|nr:hypothetical protein GW17_00032777 [Ensete ventricosum]RWW67968.1 hypothetical protein BHE74_00024540 [Ensete ventricosum]
MKSRFRLVFRALSRKFKILTILNVFLNGKLYEYDFMKKHDGHKLCTKSRFDRFFTHHLGLWCIILPLMKAT